MILDTIIAHKKTELAEAKKKAPEGSVRDAASRAPSTLDFIDAISCSQAGRTCIIAEVKKASPSKGILRHDFDHIAIARAYEDSGAAAISVLTDTRFFMGSETYLSDIKRTVSIPVFRKDFIIDSYQVYVSRALGADALLLIAAVLGPGQLSELLRMTGELGMQALVEVHTHEDLDKALQAGAQCIGINNRNLDSFVTDIQVTLNLIGEIPDTIPVVSESGIHTLAHVRTLKQAGVAAFLIGEALMRSEHPGNALAEFVSA